MKGPDFSCANKKSGKLGSLILVFLLLCAFFVVPASAQLAPGKQVLFLNSYNPGLTFSDEELRGVREILAPLGDELELSIEYMDTKKISDEEHIDNLYDLYEHKYRDSDLDLIIAADNSAFEFIVDHRDALLPGTPVVFCGVNYFTDDMIEGLDGFTGVVEDPDIGSTLDLAFQQFPDTQQIYVIHDTTNTGLAIRKHIDHFARHYESRVAFIIISDVTVRDLITIVSVLPENSVILLEAFNRDADGAVYTLEKIGDVLSDKTDLPIYINTETYLGHGVIGGMITSGYLQGKQAGVMALRILKGEPVESVPIEKESPHVYMFDYNELVEFGIQESEIPEGSIIINKPVPEQVPVWIFYIAAIVIVCLFTIILVLAFNIDIRRRIELDLRKNIAERELAQAELKKKNDELNTAYEHLSANEEELRQNYEELSSAENDLRESERKFRAIFNQTFELTGLLSVDGTILQANETALEFIGSDERNVIGKHFWETPWWTHSPEVQKEIEDAVHRAAKGEFVRFETTHLSPDMGLRYIDFSLKSVYDDEGKIVMLIPEGRDITDRRMAEDALKKALKKLNLLNSVTFNDIQNNLFSLLGYIELQRDLKDADAIGEFTEKEKQLTLKITESLEFAKNYQDLGLKEPIWQDVLQIYLYAASHLSMSNLSRSTDVEGLQIYADPLLEKVFVKMIDNTIRHGQKVTEIRLYYRETGDGLCLIYEDNGIGVPVHLKNEIFRRGYGEKKGMGLFLVREILGITDISISETGEYGKGARFEILVPEGRYRFKTEDEI